MLRTSERGTFKRCRWKWWQEFEELRKPLTDAPPLRFGTLIHLSLADYYKKGTRRGPHPAASFRKHYDAECKEQETFGFKATDDDKWVEAGTVGEAMMNHYVERYGKDDEWEVIVTEQTFQQLVYHPDSYDPNHPPEAQQNAEPWFWYVGTIDGIWRNRRTGKLSIVDHKTAKSISVMYLSLDAQATAYWTWGLDWIYQNGLLSPRERPAGMLYNHLRKAVPDERPFDLVNGKKIYLNKPTAKELKEHGADFRGSYSKTQPAPYFARTPIYRDFDERENARAQVLAEFRDMEAIRGEGERDGTSPPPESAYKNQGQFTCPGCWAFDICELHEMGADWGEMRAISTKTWEPYAAHEIYADETR